MKRKTIIISVVIIAIIGFIMPQEAKTQETLKFYDFENWRDGVNPTDWSASLTINIQAGILPIPLVLNFGNRNSSSPYAGNYDLEISPSLFEGLGGILPGFTVPGIVQLGVNQPVSIPITAIIDLISGDFDFSDPDALSTLGSQFAGLMAPGASIQGNISAFKAFIRYLPAQGSTDTARIIITTTRWNSELGRKDIVATGELVIGNAVQSYTEISTPLALSETAEDLVADSVSILIIVGDQNANSNTKLFIDNISLLGNTSSIAKNESLQYFVYPNPVSETVNITPANLQNPYTVKLFDISGKLVLEKRSLINSSTIDIKGIEKGMYLLELTQDERKQTKKIIIQ